MDKELLKDIENRAYSIYDLYQERVADYNKKLKMKVIENDNYGGRTWSTLENDIIEIYSGTIYVCFEYFSSVTRLKTGEIINFLFKNEKDIDKKNLSYEAIIFDDGKYKLLDSKNRDTKLATLLTIFCARFILSHEIGHLFNGHCDYVRSESKFLKYLPMVPQNEMVIDEEITALDYRTLEMDADAFAATDSYQELIILYNFFEEKVDLELNIRPKDLFFWWAFAIRSQTLITQDLEKKDCFKDMPNLPSVVRWTKISGVFLKCLESGIWKIQYKKGDNEDALLQEFVNGCKDAERIFNEINNTDYDWIKEIQNSHLYDEISEEVHDNWLKLREKLEK